MRPQHPIPVPAFIELCAGRAAVSWRLQHGPKARPAGSRVGCKTGYATPILEEMGLTPGQGAEQYIWAEPDDGARFLLSAMATPGLLTIVSAFIRDWDGEDPAAWFDTHRHLGLVHEDDPRSIARYFVLSQWSYRRGFPASGFNHGLHKRREANASGGHAANARTFLQEAELLKRAAAYRWPNLRVVEDARHVRPRRGYVYIDPSYTSTKTRYPQNLTRAEVLDLALQWQAAGAVVAVSEAEPLPLPGWRQVEITGRRSGQRRTFSRQQAEWLTISPTDRR